VIEFTIQNRVLRKAVAISAIIHIVILIAFMYAPALGLPFFGEKPIRINAIFVELPKGTSDDIGLGMKKAESLPKSTIEEQKNLFQPEKLNQQTLKPELKTPPQGEPEKAEKMEAPSERPKVEAKTTRKNEEKPKPKPERRLSATDLKIKNALAKIDKQLSGRTIVPEAAQVKENQDGYKYGTGTEPLKAMPNDPEYLKYQAMVRAKIIREWIVPLKYAEEGGSNYTARLDVMINTDGEVVSISWDQPSGNTTFDQSAIRAVKNASPFPKPPDKLAWEAYNEGFLVEFDPRLKPSY
jgi:TonB family protein